MMETFTIDPDIHRAETIPSWFYRSDIHFEGLKDKVFTGSWQWVGDHSLVSIETSVYPFVFMDQYLEEPMILVRDPNGQLILLSNVCTHRGNIIVHHPGRFQKLICSYHGRRFSLEGKMEHMPEFKGTENFPGPCDHLAQFPLVQWGPFLFTSIQPTWSLQPVIDIMQERVGFLSLEEYRFDPSSSKDYLVHSHWALYCDNYLEGFHIPFVHKELNQILDYGQYETVLYDNCNLQIGYGDEGSDCFDLPPNHPDFGKNIAAYYFWVFPNMMFNFYPWGLSINIVKPITKDKTRVRFLTYLPSGKVLESHSQALIDKVEREDEFVVEGVHQGLKSRIYHRGRYSPKMEKGVHHFHRLLEKFIFNVNNG